MASARDVWAKRVRQWLESGQTAADFAASHGINPRTLTYWKWRLGREAASRQAESTASEPAQFVEVTPPSSWWRASERIEVVVDDEVVVRVPNDFEAETLRRVLVVLDVLEES
jgi:transposase-like protein